MGELLVSKEGLGYLINYGSQVFNLDLVMTGVFVLSIVSVVMYYAIVLFMLIYFPFISLNFNAIASPGLVPLLPLVRENRQGL